MRKSILSPLTSSPDDTRYRIQTVILKFLNVKHEKRREGVGKVAKVVDQSMSAVRAADQDTEAVKNTQNPLEDRSLEDLTDWQNEDFVYVY